LGGKLEAGRMTITGELFIGNERIGGSPTLEAVNPATGERAGSGFSDRSISGMIAIFPQ
jgi:hypothetical protein